MPKLRLDWWGGWVPRVLYFRHPCEKCTVRHCVRTYMLYDFMSK